jgi:uncharacterized coiled-coil protein SlyX
VLSAIGEPLRAEIDLTVAAEDLDSATPRLAPPDAYAAAGLQYNAALNGARLAIQYRQNGRRVISLMTLRPVNEPSIPVLVELDVRGGRIARTYNVLLGLSAEAAASVPSPVALAPAPVAPVKTAPANTATANTATANTARTNAVPAAVPVTAAPAAAVPRAVRAAEPSKASAAPAGRSRYDREIQRLESQLAAGDKILADLLDRVALMEREVRQMQHALTLQGKIPSPKPDVVAPPAGVVEQTTALPVSTAPVAAIDSLPPQQRSRPAKQDYLNEALLVLAGGVLILLGWLAYWVWARRQGKGAGDTAEPTAES